MKLKYKNWIAENVPDNCTNMCMKYACGMADEFPELKPVSGWFYDSYNEAHEHWWCTTEDGEVVDPTRSQFRSDGGEYEIVNEKRPECFDKCPNCGIIFDMEETGTTTVCSEYCHEQYLNYIQGIRI